MAPGNHSDCPCPEPNRKYSNMKRGNEYCGAVSSKSQLRGVQSRELYGGVLLTGCDCVKHNGLQDDCLRQQCHNNPCCRTKPEPLCAPAMLVRQREQRRAQIMDKYREKAENDNLRNCPSNHSNESCHANNLDDYINKKTDRNFEHKKYSGDENYPHILNISINLKNNDVKVSKKHSTTDCVAKNEETVSVQREKNYNMKNGYFNEKECPMTDSNLSNCKRILEKVKGRNFTSHRRNGLSCDYCRAWTESNDSLGSQNREKCRQQSKEACNECSDKRRHKNSHDDSSRERNEASVCDVRNCPHYTKISSHSHKSNKRK